MQQRLRFEADDTDTSDVIGGVDAKSASLDAIGGLVYTDARTSATQLLCTATLIAPNVVLTAKHCAMEKWTEETDGGPAQVVEARYLDTLNISFAVGSDIRTPKRLVRVASVETCNVANSGFMGLGCDVAVYHLQESIDDIRPLKVAPGMPSQDLLGKRLLAIGYGLQAQDSNTTQVGTRKLGNVTLRALSGAPMKLLFPTVEGFIDAMRDAEGEAYVDNIEQPLRDFYETQMLPGYELFVGAMEGDAQICSGDSGGPLLAKIDNRPRVAPHCDVQPPGVARQGVANELLGRGCR